MEILTTDHFENMWKEGGTNQEFLVKFCQSNWIFLSVRMIGLIYQLK